MLDYAHLAAVAAVIRSGSFEKAAQQLNVTPSAVSQRVKLLEERLGTVLIIRGQPCTATDAGRRFCRHVDEVALLEQALHSDLGGLGPASEPSTLRIAINADSLATWFVDAMASVEGRLFDLVLDDQDHSADWLKRGEVVAAISALPQSVQGCDVRPLGALRYIATASPAFVDRWFPNGPDTESLTRAPTITFNTKDELQIRWVQEVFGRRLVMPSHWLPSTQAFIDATLAGIGWGMNPERLVEDHIADGRLVVLQPGRPLDVALHWHCSRMLAAALSDVTSAVVDAAKRWLVPGA